VTPLFLQRAAALAAAALLAGTFAVALGATRSDEGDRALPEPAVGPGGVWPTAPAGVATVGRGRPSGCGWAVRSGTLGVVHPVLRCGVKIFVEHGGRRALTRVVAHAPVAEGRQLDLTPALAKRLGIEGVREIAWAYAR
jgi:hypothetical protein